MKTAIAVLSLLLFANSAQANEFSVRDFFMKEDEKVQVTENPLIALGFDASSIFVLSKVTKRSILTLKDTIDRELAPLYTRHKELRGQLAYINNERPKIKRRLEALKSNNKMVNRNNHQITSLKSKLETFRKQANAINDELFDLSKEIRVEKVELLKKRSQFTDPRLQRKFDIHYRIRNLALLGILISIADISGHIITPIFSPKEADFVPGEGIKELMEIIIIDSLKSDEENLETIEKQLDEIEEFSFYDEMRSM